MFIWALGKMGYCPEQHWLGHFLSPTYAHPDGFSDHDLGVLLWGLHLLNIIPGADWLLLLFQSTQQRLGRLPPEVGRTGGDGCVECAGFCT